ncbi:uncharacterized protein TNCV_3463931 [Trichonephila clavipes]|nr:uncharacterized protein TNCV_3463931 [Trichonephila clavipes]
MAVSNAENASVFDRPLLFRCGCCARLHSFIRRQGRILLARKSQSHHHLAFEIYSLLHRLPSRFLHFLCRVLEILGSIGQSRQYPSCGRHGSLFRLINLATAYSTHFTGFVCRATYSYIERQYM